MNEPARYEVRFPEEADQLTVETEYFYLRLKDGERIIQLHDYQTIYQYPGLYEAVVLEKLQCRSPQVVIELLAAQVQRSGMDLTELVVFDFGAGCGVSAELLRSRGVASITGLDIIPEAAEAARRDRPGVYDTYHVGDICNLGPDTTADLQQQSFNTLICVSAMALGHVEPDGFATAFNLIPDGGWIAFNILKDSFDGRSSPVLAGFYQEVIKGSCMDVHAEHIYTHRIMMNGAPLENLAVVGRKVKDLSAN